MPYTPFVAPGGQDLTPNGYSDVGGGVLNQTVISQYDLYKPNELVQVFQRHSGYASWRLMIRAMGFSRASKAPTVGHYEYPWRDNLVTVGSVVSGSGAGNPVVIALDAGDMFDTNVTANGAARQASYPIKNMSISFPDGSMAVITEKDTSVTPHQLTLVPMDPTVDLSLIINAGEGYFIASNNHTEGSDLPAGHTPRIIEYSNTFQIIKGASYATGSELTNEMIFEPIDEERGSFYLKVKEDMMFRYEEDFDGALIWGQQNTNPALVEFNQELQFDAPITGTEGMIPYVLTNGFEDNYTVGSYNINELDEISRYYEGERIGVRDIMCLQGIDLNIELENTLQALLNADLTAQLSKDWLGGGSFGFADDSYMNPSDFALRIGFRAIKKSNYNYTFHMLHNFNKNTGAGSAAYNYRNWQIMYPVGYAKEKSSGTRMPTVGYEYKAQDGYSRETVVSEYSGAGANSYTPAVNPFDIRTCAIVSEIAGHNTCGNHMVIQRPV